ncbi:unnamed protein product [Rhizopus stolonifer]
MATHINKCSEGTQLVTVDLSDISKLPTDLYLPQGSALREQGLFAVYQLILRRNTLTSLKPYIDAIGKIKKNLMHLSLRENKLSRFPIETTSLPNLTSLSLAENNLKFIESGIFPRLVNLQWLNLAKNSLESLPVDIVECFKLRGLDMSNNMISKFPDVVFFLPYLKALLLDGNKITAIPSHFKFPATLEVLTLASNSLTEIPLSLIYRPPAHLAHLNLSGNLINELHVDFLSIGYEYLTSLDMHSCKLTSCPSWFLVRLGARPQLKRVNLALNQITEIPFEIGSLTQLQWLNLNGNFLTSLPTSMSALSKLVKLGIAQNRIKTLPPLLFIHMQRLEKLDIRRNLLKYFPPSILSLIKIYNRLVNLEIFVPHNVFSSFDLRSTCDLHKTSPSYYETLFGKRVCEHCHPFGGELDDLFLAGNLKLQYVTGILCEPNKDDNFESTQILSQSTAFSLLASLPKNSSCKTMKQTLYRAICQEKKQGDPAISLEEMEYCHSPKFSRKFFSTPDSPPQLEEEKIEWDMVKAKVRGILTETPSLQEIALSTRLNSTQTEFYNGRHKDYHEYFKDEKRLDHSPKRTKHFITRVLSYPCIPTFVKQAAVNTSQQCDACLKWYSYSNIKVGYISRLPDNGTSIPIRYQMCSFNCALDSLVNLFVKTQEWQSKNRGFRTN